MKVYLITSGSYSDYCVHCAFTTIDLAIEYAAAMNKITPDQQSQLEAISVMYYGQYEAARRKSPPEVQKALDNDGYRVEERDLFDSLPITGTNPSAIGDR